MLLEYRGCLDEEKKERKKETKIKNSILYPVISVPVYAHISHCREFL